eukprot:s1549_g2.t1
MARCDTYLSREGTDSYIFEFGMIQQLADLVKLCRFCKPLESLRVRIAVSLVATTGSCGPGFQGTLKILDLEKASNLNGRQFVELEGLQIESYELATSTFSVLRHSELGFRDGQLCATPCLCS